MVALQRDAYGERVVTFATTDGRTANVVHVQGPTPPTRPPVLLVHGAGVRANIFRAPVETNIVDFLIARGHDVWLENWRASIDFEPNEWTLDQAAVHDHPAAVQTVCRETGADRINAVIHCQGSTSFMMSAVAGLVPEVQTIVANAVSLHPVVPAFSNVKLKLALPALRLVTQYLDPSWGEHAPTLFAKALVAAVRTVHRECDSSVCRMVSFVYGSGFPALWRHENLNAETHDWIRHEFGAVPLSFFRQIARSSAAGRLVPVEGYSELPLNFLDRAPQTDARFAFIAGAVNRCFLAESQRRTFEFFDRERSGYHALHIVPAYSHLDVFMGKNASRDTFPLIAAELERESVAATRKRTEAAGLATSSE